MEDEGRRWGKLGRDPLLLENEFELGSRSLRDQVKVNIG